jgi:hypothetical protein
LILGLRISGRLQGMKLITFQAAEHEATP